MSEPLLILLNGFIVGVSFPAAMTAASTGNWHVFVACVAIMLVNGGLGISAAIRWRWHKEFLRKREQGFFKIVTEMDKAGMLRVVPTFKVPVGPDFDN